MLPTLVQGHWTAKGGAPPVKAAAPAAAPASIPASLVLGVTGPRYHLVGSTAGAAMDAGAAAGAAAFTGGAPPFAVQWPCTSVGST